LLVKRIVQIVTFDPVILNEQSPANTGALTWYRRALREHPNSFPTELVKLDEPEGGGGITWKTVNSDERLVVVCP